MKKILQEGIFTGTFYEVFHYKCASSPDEEFIEASAILSSPILFAECLQCFCFIFLGIQLNNL